MLLSRGLLASTLLHVSKAQDGIDQAAVNIATGFAETLIQHAYTTLNGDSGSAGDAGNGGNQGQAFDASLLDKQQNAADNDATVTQIIQGQVTVETYTRPGGVLFPVTLLPHPRITLAPSRNDPYERIIQAYTGGSDATTNQEITIAEPSGTNPGTILVDVPGTAYSSFSSGQAGALTIPPSNDNPTATIISALPSGVTITGEATRTIPAAGNAPATVVIQTPWADVPPSTPGAGGAGAGGAVGGNVGGSTSNVLVIQTYTGTEYITQARVSTIVGSGGDQGTVVVQVPQGDQNPGGAVTIPPSDGGHFTTILRQYTGASAISTPVTILVPTSAGQDGTIIIETPGPSSTSASGGDSDLPENQPQVIPPSGDNPYSTILRPHAGSDPITEPVTYTVPPSGTNPGTIIIETPAVRAGQQVITLPSDPNSGYITIVRQPNSAITAPNTITIAPTGGQPGTIIIETPAPQPGDVEITIPPGQDGSFVTIIQGPTGSDAVTVPNTITITGAPGQPGTIIIQTSVPSGGGQITRGPGDPFTIPAGSGQYVTVFRPHSGDPISVPITLTQPGTNGQPGTIIIETPDPTTSAPGSGPITIPAGGNSPFVTIYRPHSGSPISAPVTITIPASGTQPGTIVVETPVPTLETPKGQNAVISSPAGGQPITIPPSKNNPYVTIYRPHTGDPITVPITITQSPSNGQPGTIIIETPAPPADTVTETEPGATVTVQPDNPGGYVTIYRPHTGDPISEPITVTTISGSNGQPGTVIIETQGPFTITATGPGGTATIYTPGSDVSTTVTKTVTLTASGGQQSTAVVIETPPPVKVQPTTAMATVTGPDGYVTITEQYTGASVITAIFTTTVTGSGTNPGTVYIETPPPIKFAPTSTVSGTDNYVTIYEPFPGTGIITAPITVTQATPSGGQPGTVIIQTPIAETPATTPLPDPTTTQGPNGYVTVYLPFPGPGVITTSYTRTQAPSGGNPGTVFITTPAPLSATTSEANLPSTTSGTDGYVTVFIPYPGPGEITAPITRTQPPENGQPGTVFITTPVPAFTTPKQMNGLTTTSQGTDGYVTVFVPYPGPGEITAPITSTQTPANGQPGTVWITTPAPAFTTPKQMYGLTTTSQGTDGYVTVFMPFPGPGVITAPITSTQPPANGQPGTVFITTPAPLPTDQQNVPTTTAGDDQYVTVFLPFPGPGVITTPITRTQAPSSGNPGTVFITTPAPETPTQPQTSALTTDNYITMYTPFPGPGVITAPITITKPPSNGQPGTVLIETPVPLSSSADTYVTVYRPYPGPGTIAAPITLTQAPSNGQPGTVFIETQPTETPTPMQTTDGSTPPITIPPDPTGSYVTIYRPYPGPGQITSPITYTQAPVSGQPGTIIIETPNPDANTATQTGPVTVPTGNNNPYVTVYKPYPGPGNIDQPITITAATPSGDQPGTIIIETPTLEVNTKFAPSPTSSPPVTIPIDNNNYVTVYRPHTGSPITAPIAVTTIAPSGGQPGTVIIETPGPESQSEAQPTTTDSPPVTIPQGQDGYVTVYRPYPGPGVITAPVTVTTIAPTNGQPGTVIIETPAPEAPTSSSSDVPQTTASAVTIPADNAGYVTVYRPYPGPGTITAPLTVGTVAPTNGQPGTVIIETPLPQAAPETTSTPEVTSTQGTDGYITVFQPYTGTGLITAPITVSTIPPSNGQPGTIIVETPVTQAPTTTTSDAAPATIPPGPDNSHVTVYRPHTGTDVITVPVTVTTIQGVHGQPGTIIIETPVPQAPTSTDETTEAAPVTIPPGPDSSYITVYRLHTGTDVITAPVIVTTIPGVNGQPGTIIIETPAAQDTNAPSTATASPGSTYITEYRPYPGPGNIDQPITVTTIEPSNGNPGTVIIETPTPDVNTKVAQPPVTLDPGPGDQYVTVYRPYTGTGVITAPVTVSTIAPSGGQPGTVIIETPEPETPGPNPTVTLPAGPNESYITVFRPHTGTDVITGPVTITTIAPANGQPGTVIIETPVASELGSTPAPVDSATIAPPQATYVTVYRPHTGVDRITAPVTVSTIAPSSDQPGTIVVETPGAEPPVTTSPPPPTYTTVYEKYSGTDDITEPFAKTTIEPQGDQPGTIIFDTPAQRVVSTSAAQPSYITVYQPHSGPDRITAPVTVTTIPPLGDQPGTVIIETPGSELPVTSTPEPTSQPSYITIYRPHTGADQITSPVTITTIEPQGDQPGTVIIETPGSELPVTSTPAPAPEPSYVTVYRPHTGADQITAPVTITTIEPQGDQPGTVIIETPDSEPAVTSSPEHTPQPSYVTVYRPQTGADRITAPITITTIEPQGDQAGTVIIETPGSEPPVTSTPAPSYTTIYEPYTGTGEITGEVTVTTIPPQGDQPGTVIIETPGPQTANKGASPPLTIPAGDDGYVTVFRPYTGTPMIKAPVTVTTISPSTGNPRTVIIETPAPEAAATTSRPEDVYVTVYTIYTGTGQLTAPTTVTTIAPISGTGIIIIETQAEATSPPPVTIPPSDNSPNITIVRQYPGPGIITAPVTSYEPPSTPGQPGTIIIETPAPISETTSEAPGTNVTLYTLAPPGVKTPITSYAPPQTPGQPGTVFIQTVATDAESTSDEGRNVTIYTDGPDSLTAPYTTYYPPASPGDPGTVLIETPPSVPTGPASVSAVPTTDDSAGGITTPASSNPDALTLTPSDSNDDFTVIEPNTRFADASENVTQIIPATDGTPGTQIIYTPVDTSGDSSAGAPDTDSYVTISATVTIPGDPSTRTGLNSGARSDVGTTGAETNVIIIPPSGTEPGTVLSQTSVYLDQPLAEHGNVTITRTAPSGVTTWFTTYSPPAQSTDPGTIIIEIPDYNITITRAAPTDITTTITTYSPPASPGDPGTVIIETPDYNVTITREAPASITSLRTSYAPPGTPGDPGTVIVETSNNDYNVTITRGASITAPFTTYSPPGASGDPGTIIVETPDYNVTITREAPASITDVRTAFNPPGTPGDPGTVIVETPNNAYNVTITRAAPASITSIYTTYSPPGAPGDPGTVIVETPDYNVTVTSDADSADSVTDVVTRYNPPGTPGESGTIAIIMPNQRVVSTSQDPSTTDDSGQNVTIYRPGPRTLTGPVTSYIPPASRGDNGTVIIETPGPATSFNVTITQTISTITAIYTTYSPPGAEEDPGTVIVEIPPDRNVTITEEVSTITAPYTTYSPPGSPGDPGTVIIEVPPDHNVTFTEVISTITSPYTRYSPPANRGDPGTVYIGLPPDSNVTITTEVDSRTAPYTTYYPPSSKGDPGTILVELPPGRNVTITTEVPSRTAPYTTYAAPANKGDPGTIIIELPPDRNVTTTEEFSTITRVRTTYIPPANQGDPGTVLVQEPPDTNTTIVDVVSTITRPATRFVPAATKGDPGTVYIDVPPNHNVTMTTTVSTITRPSTTFEPPATEGDAGTILVQMPPEYNVTVTTTIYSITRQSTTFAPGATQGDPGTIFIEMPPEYNVTTTQTVETISRPVTRYSKAGTVGDPNTIYVDLPPEYNVTITTTVDTITRPSTTFAPAGTQGDPGTIIVELPPDSNVTTTRTISTISRPTTHYSRPGTVGDPGTMYVDLPPEYNVTITTTIETITRPSTTFAPAGTQGDPGTIIVELPPDSNVTVASTVPTISRPATRFASPAAVGDPGTVYVDLPPEYNVTTTETVSTISRVRTTFNPAATEGDPGTILVEVPVDYNVTTTELNSSINRVRTTYMPAGTQGDPNTILIEIPPDYTITTTETVSSITRVRTTYMPAGTQGDANTVLIEVPPDYNVTSTETVSSIKRVRTTYMPAGTQGDPNTVLVQVPPEYTVTTTETNSGISRVRTSYMAAATQGDPNTVLIEVPPDYNVTSTETIGTINRVRTSYYPAGTQGDPNTVLIQVPPDYTLTTTETNSAITRVRTTYMPAATQGDPNTVLVEVPPDFNVTTTQTNSAISRIRTTYMPAGTQGDPNTVLVEVPVDYNVTTTETNSAITRVRTTYNPGATQGDPGTILVQVPMDYNVTTTETVSTISRARTTYNPASVQGDPNTVLVQVPVDYNVTTTQTVSTISRVRTSYYPAATQGDPNTVLVQVPMDYNVTVTDTITTISRVRTTYGPAATQGDPGTIYVDVPPEYNVTLTSTVSTISRPYTTYSAPGTQGDPGTIWVMQPPAYNVATTQTVPTITHMSTTYAPAATQGDPGTFIVQVPPDSNVTTTETVATISRPATRYVAPATQGDPGTVVVQMPPSYNVTSTQTVSTISRLQTAYSAPATQGDPGTVWVRVPPEYNVTSTTTVSTISRLTTTYAPPATQGDPGTFIVRVPPSYNVTTTQTVSTISRVATAYSPPATQGDPGTVIIQMPPAYNVTTTTTVSTISRLTTTYAPPATQGDPGTFIVRVPPKYTVTTTQTASTITRPTTIFAPAQTQGDPDTVIVEYPPPYNVTVTTAGPTTLTARYTTYSPPGQPGDPGTVIVQMPPSRTVTITTNGGTTISTPVTSTYAPGEPGDPATVVIATPAPRSTTSTTSSKPYTTTTTTTTAPAATVSFNCDVYGYLMQKTALYRVEITSGKTTLIKSDVGPGGWINAIGYNRFDNYIYGMHMDDTGSQVIRIGGDGGWTLLGTRTNDRLVQMGDIDNQGRFWISNQGEGWWCIDLMPGSSTYGKILMSGTAKNPLNSADWAFVPGGGDFMYSIMYDDQGKTSTLCKFSRTTYTWTTIQGFGMIAGQNVWGAAYASQDGNLYGSENTSGQIWMFPIAPSVGTPKFLATGPSSSWNDGARCIDSQTLQS
ncbi:hypothetical protein FGADI_5077 [Fusarium gaditjirri]|uniref:Agglutinin-like protein 2 n=1 Tax=Fusarium gaditjirri TaxID=282569 RepID=A0A8H4TBJ7_9HYPO|nr:hypothetical protein FGADI_5077 [Fusarium gaditjirri]